MKHNIKLPDGTIQTLDCRLGSGIVDKHGKEIFEGDIFKFPNGSKYTAMFVKGSFVAKNEFGIYDLSTLKLSEAEIIGHVDD